MAGSSKPNPRSNISSSQIGSPTDPNGWFEDTLSSAASLGMVFSEPAAPTSHIANVNGLQIRYLDWGNPRLPDLLFVHGFAQQAHSWDFASLAMRDRFHVICIDLRGHGESDRSPDGEYSIDAMYSDLDAFITEVGLRKPVICGLSLGGTLSYIYASQNPDSVSALVIAESAPESNNESPNEGRTNIRNFTSGPSHFDSLDELIEKVRRLTPWRSPEQIRSSLTHSVTQDDLGKWTWKYDPAIRQMLSSGRPDQRHLWDALSSITVPTLLIRGEDSDTTNTATFERMASTIAHSTLVSIPRAGHRVSGDNPQAFNSAVQGFLLKNVYRTEECSHVPQS